MIKNKSIAKVITNLFIIGFLGYLSGKFVHKFTDNDNLWLGFNYYFFTGIFILVTLLIFNNYLWFTVISLVLILGAVLFIYFKANPTNLIEAANNIEANNGSTFGAMKQNPMNFSLFFWVMFTTTAVTVVGIIIASKAYKKMKLKEGRLGDKGEEGPRGKEGPVSPILNSPGEICYQQLLEHCEKILEEIKRERNLPFSDGEIHLKNLNFKDHIKRIAHSRNFTDEIMKLLRCKLGCKTPAQIKRTYCRSKDRFMAFIIAKVKQDLTQWIRRMCMYKKGLVYLSQEMKIPRDWETLYITPDKELGLKPDPHDHFQSLSFNWGCDSKSNYTDCESCPRPSPTGGVDADDNSETNGDSQSSSNNSSSGLSSGCNVTREEINNILSDAFTPSSDSDSDNNSNKTTKAGIIGNYTWNWGAV